MNVMMVSTACAQQRHSLLHRANNVRIASAVLRRPAERFLLSGVSTPLSLYFFQPLDVPPSALLVSRRSFRYSAYDSIKKPWRNPGGSNHHEAASLGIIKGRNEGKSSSSGSSTRVRDGSEAASQSGTSTATNRSTIRTRDGPNSSRPLQSIAQDKRDARKLFPRTLKSGRPAEQATVSQQLHFSKLSNLEDFAKQEAIDKEYTRRVREAEAARGVDKRFFTRVSDYRDIADGDPYAGVFGESAGTQKLRTAAWQRQFEKENEHVELPYERTNVIAKLAPNWFVRYFVNLRDKGGADHLHFFVFCGLAAFTLLSTVGYLFYTPPSKTHSIREVR